MVSLTVDEALLILNGWKDSSATVVAMANSKFQYFESRLSIRLISRNGKIELEGTPGTVLRLDIGRKDVECAYGDTKDATYLSANVKDRLQSLAESGVKFIFPDGSDCLLLLLK